MKNNIGLAGLGYLGKIHLKLLKENANWHLKGVFDIDEKLTRELAEQYQVKAYASAEEMMNECDAVDIVTPGKTHFELARLAITKGKHVFVEKPLAATLQEARALRQLVHEAGVCLQVGHVERFNPAFTAALPWLKQPRFIEIHRLAQYNVRGTDVSVVLDLTMHDLDLLLSVVKAGVKKISAYGAALVSRSPDLVNARIEFDNGCVANITTSRLAFNNVRKFRAFCAENLVNINLLERVTEVIKIKNADKESKNLVIDPGHGLPKKEIVFEHPVIFPTNAINDELNAFYESVCRQKPIIVGIDDAINVMELAFEIEEKIKA